MANIANAMSTAMGQAPTAHPGQSASNMGINLAMQGAQRHQQVARNDRTGKRERSREGPEPSEFSFTDNASTYLGEGDEYDASEREYDEREDGLARPPA
eukprot:959193-Pleurochrysis_carterae.AAC.1